MPLKIEVHWTSSLQQQHCKQALWQTYVNVSLVLLIDYNVLLQVPIACTLYF